MPKRAPDLPRPPIGLAREEAAAFVGVSPTTFDRMIADGLMPPARRIYARKVWDADECAQWFRRLPYDATSEHASDRASPYAEVRA